MLAYLVSQHHDVFAFEFWRRRTGGKHLWLRNNASTIVSQGIDTVLFISIAFAGSVPTSVLLNMILGQCLVKLVIAVIDTPICYGLVSPIRSRNDNLPEYRGSEAVRAEWRMWCGIRLQSKARTNRLF